MGSAPMVAQIMNKSNNMTNKSSNSKRIAKNTGVLYIRSVVVMLITLYTSRVILQALGVEDYGLYNVIGGVVALFSFLKTSMTKSTQRFLNVEMVNPNGRLKETFMVSMTIHVIISVIALVLLETVGLWFLNNYIQIPEGREYAANIVYQSTVISLALTIISVPYNAAIISHEKMGFFAVVSIADAILKLAICFMIMWGNHDRLIVYGWLMMCIHVINLLMQTIYCRYRIPEARFKLMYDKQLFKDMLGYTTWTVVGQVAIVGTNQGNNILVNMFHSVTANAGMGVASQVNGAVVSLTSNFQTAFNPQITKSFAAKDYDYLKKLVYSTSKISYFLLLVVCLPITFNIDLILNLWLTTVPPYAAVFCILVLCNSILNALSAPLNFSVLSSGNIKWFQIMTSLVYLSDLVIVYVLFSLGLPAPTALVVKVCIMVAILFVRLIFANREVPSITLISFFKEVLFPLFAVTAICVMIGYFMFGHVALIWHRIIATAILVITTLTLVLIIGMQKSEKQQLKNMILKRKNKK